jgi:hypothetical protein
VSAVAGIDFDSNGVFVALVDEDDGGWLGHQQIDLACGPGDSFQRSRRVRDLMPSRGSWDAAGVVAVGIESTFSRDFRAATALARVQGAIVSCLPRTVPLYLLTAHGRKRPGWKLLTVGQTNASKAHVKQWAINRGAPAGLVQDTYDAFAIAIAARHLNTRR